MKHTLKLLIAAVLSLSAGVAFASPLYFSDTNIAPYPRLPEGQKANMSASVVFANFTVQTANSSLPAPSESSIQNATPTSITFNVVLNVTNYSDKASALSQMEVTVAKKIYSGEPTIPITGRYEGPHKGAWLDGQWVNVTWIPPEGIPFANPKTLPQAPNYTYPSFHPIGGNGTGYWRAGVELSITYTQGNISEILMLLNGTWTDVTGRIVVPDLENPADGAVGASGVIADQVMTFQTLPSADSTPNVNSITGRGTVLCGPNNFDDSWAPGQSRLILFKGTCFTDAVNALSYLQAGSIGIQLTGQGRLVDSLVNGSLTDTSAAIDATQYIQLQSNGNVFVYNPVLAATQQFQPDQWGVEVFIQPGS
jgi:hypothetical protein